MSGWNGSDRRSRLPKDWPERVKAVKDRAGGRCQARLPRSGKRCPRPGTECDHIVENDDHRLENLQWLCHEHHEQKTIAHAIRSKYRRRRARAPKRAEERHPGLRHGTMAEEISRT